MIKLRWDSINISVIYRMVGIWSSFGYFNSTDTLRMSCLQLIFKSIKKSNFSASEKVVILSILRIHGGYRYLIQIHNKVLSN